MPQPFFSGAGAGAAGATGAATWGRLSHPNALGALLLTALTVPLTAERTWPMVMPLRPICRDGKRTAYDQI